MKKEVFKIRAEEVSTTFWGKEMGEEGRREARKSHCVQHLPQARYSERN